MRLSWLPVQAHAVDFNPGGNMHNTGAAKWPTKAVACALMFSFSVFSLGLPAQAGDPDKPVDKIKTATPIKHVIIIVGENRSFDHLFATYVPKHEDEKVLNLLSEGIVNADGTPGPNFAKAHQYQIVSAPLILRVDVRRGSDGLRHEPTLNYKGWGTRRKSPRSRGESAATPGLQNVRNSAM
jgi:hypothetical protein